MQQLAILTEIRHYMSDAEKISNSDLLYLVQNSNLIDMLLKILQAPCDPQVRILKLEAGWILTNIAYGDDEVIESFFTPSFIEVFACILQSSKSDLVLLDQVMFFIGNISGTKKYI